MNRVTTLLFSAGLLLFSFTGCKKEEKISNTPALKFVSMSPNPAVKYQDEVRIVVEYTDGDGDLGENTPDIKNLFVTDSRNSVTYQFRIPQLAPDSANIIIQGNQVINLPPQGFVDDNNTTETTTYSVYVVDRAGNQSNVLKTPELTIVNP